MRRSFLARMGTAGGTSAFQRPADGVYAFHTMAKPEKQCHYDLVVLGSGPAGQKCAIDSAKRGKSVLVVDKAMNAGGVCVHTGTIPSKTFREAVISLTGYRSRSVPNAPAMNRINSRDILDRVRVVEHHQTSIVLNQLKRNNVNMISGYGRFLGPNEVAVDAEDGSVHHYTAKNVMISVGTHPNRGKGMPFNHRRVYDGDLILSDDLDIPRSLIVVGAGVIGMEYATAMNVIPGTRVTVIDGVDRLLGFCDHEITDVLVHTFRADGGRLVLNDTVEGCEVTGDNKVVAHLKSGKQVFGDALLYCMGRQASTAGLNIQSINALFGRRGQLAVSEHYQCLDNTTKEPIPGVYAAGDVIGFPALASTSMEQGRRASCHMWGESITMSSASTEFFPMGIYTVPEISCVGRTEQELSAKGIRYEVGVARYEELARSHLVGDVTGMLKLIFCPTTLKLLGVQVIGEGATEIIHIGQAVMALGGTVEYFRNTVFNYPTFAEAYRVAAIAGLGTRPIGK
eukprot:PhM_4_TR5028/c0_g1_i1/m.105860/K00322/sthA, udhA; NAD(P) transhydrogenase